MNGRDFIRRVTKLGRKRGIAVRFVVERGKGSHGTLYFGDRLTVVKDRRKDISPGLFAKMLRDLAIDRTEF